MEEQLHVQNDWPVDELHRRLAEGEVFYVLDVRNEDEFEGWKIEGVTPLPMKNVPYYEMLEVDEHDDVVDSFKDYIEGSLAGELPREVPVLAVCAKGDTSAYVAEALRRLGYSASNLAGGMEAWGDHYAIRPVTESAELAIYQVVRPARGCMSYVVASGGKALVVDPLRHVERYLDLARDKGLTIELVLDTHAHADHISGGPALSEATGAPYYLHPYDGIHPIDVLPARIPYEYLREGQELTVGTVRVEALHIPGHTLGNMAYLIDGRYLLTGDSIFLESIARPDLGGRGDTWAPLHYGSLRRLLALPPETVVLPAHFSRMNEAGDDGLFAGRLGDLRETNDGLEMVERGEEEFVAYILASLPEFPEEYVEIKRVNAGLVTVGEEKASELELGKNVCALAESHPPDSGREASSASLSAR